MKSQVILHIETAISHLKAASMKAGMEEHKDIADWLCQRGEAMLKNTDYSDIDDEGALCVVLSEYFHHEYARWKEAIAGSGGGNHEAAL